ncbi:MAG: hypothetical protein Q9222_002222 [Ikaeria aurantiellina]
MINNTSAPAPIIPERTSVRTPRQRRRRRSLPNTPSISAAKPSPNHVNVKPASTEVISSLISSLSAISDSTEDRCDSALGIRYPRSIPTSPNPHHIDFSDPVVTDVDRSLQGRPSSPSKLAFGMEHGLNRRLYLSSPAHASLRSSHSYQDLRPRSRLVIEGDDDDTSSIGQVSIEPAPQRSRTSIASAGTGQQKSVDLGSGIQRRTEQGKQSHKRDSRQNEGERLDRVHDLISKSPRAPSIHSATTNGRYSTDLSGSPMVGSGYIIPSRESSLRHSFGGSSSHRKRRSKRSNDSIAEGRPLSIDTHNLQPRSESPGEASMDSAPDEITRRIKELKDQKRLRDISLSVTTPDLLPPSPRTSRSPSPLRALHSPDAPAIALPKTNELQDTPKKDTESEKNDENSAPSPAVVQRVERKSKRNSISGIPFTLKSFSGTRPAEPNRTQSTPIQRSNSKLLRRLSRPTSPAIAEKHRRTISHPIAEPCSPFERPKSADPIDKAVDDYISAPRLSQTVTLPQTGRLISFSEVGDPEGSVVFCCVGMGLTRYIMSFYDDLAKTLKLRLITPDRPGVGGSELHTNGTGTPLGWPDDVLAICQELKLTKFSLLAHSAGAIYALATALRMAQHIRGRIHLLAPWIPPSQMSGIGTQQESLPVSALPLTQRLLQSLPTIFLRAANSNYLRTTSASITTNLPKSPRRSKRKNNAAESTAPPDVIKAPVQNQSLTNPKTRNNAIRQESFPKKISSSDDSDSSRSIIKLPLEITSEKERQSTYDSRLTNAIWDASTTGANPAVDLLVCLERKQPIGFRYVDITRSVIIHHGSKDTRVPIENVKWLGKTMRRARIDGFGQCDE